MGSQAGQGELLAMQAMEAMGETVEAKRERRRLLLLAQSGQLAEYEPTASRARTLSPRNVRGLPTIIPPQARRRMRRHELQADPMIVSREVLQQGGGAYLMQPAAIIS